VSAVDKFCRECGRELIEQAEAAETSSGDAFEEERRQVTVMFCDLKDSTALIHQLGAEKYRLVERRYRSICVPIVEQYDGFISRFMGDGFLALFGYPVAHDDDEERAVRVGLEIARSITSTRFEVGDPEPLELAVRMGIATGIVVSGEVIGSGASEEHTISGETPNLAARIQQIAPPNSVVVSSATHRLVRDSVVSRSAGAHSFKGFSEPLEVFEIVDLATDSDRSSSSPTLFDTSLVGRERELTLLRDSWTQVQRGEGCIVLIQGDAGIGKSRLVREIAPTVRESDHHWLECRCSPYFRNSALYPIIDLLRRESRVSEQDDIGQISRKLEARFAAYSSFPEQLAYLASLMDPHGAAATGVHPINRNRPLNAVVALLASLADEKPLVLVVEDLHWIDPSTEHLLSSIIDQAAMAPILALLTARPEYQVDWLSHGHTMQLTPSHLKPFEVEAMISELTRNAPIPTNARTQLVFKTDGVPLYVEELTRAVIESAENPQQTDLSDATVQPPLPIPASLRDSLMARLDRLGSPKRLIQLASALGRMFPFRHLQAASGLDADKVETGLDQLVKAELLYQRGVPPDSVYQFKHSLTQNAAYDSTLASKRREYHRRIASILTNDFPEVDAANPELVARHYVLAGNAGESLALWSRAAQNALRRGVGLEAIAHSKEGLSYIGESDSSRDKVEREIELQTTLAAALSATYGFATPEVRQAYEQALDLCRANNASPNQIFPVIEGLHQIYLLDGHLTKARELDERLVKVAKKCDRPYERGGEANRCLGWTLFCLGELHSAEQVMLHALSLYDRAKVDEVSRLVVLDAGGIGLSNLSWIKWFLGDVEGSLEKSKEAIARAREIDHPFTLAYTLCVTAALHQFRREPAAVASMAEEVLSIALKHEFSYWSAWGTSLRGWAEFSLNASDIALQKIRKGLDWYRETGSTMLAPYILTLLAECELQAGKASKAKASLNEALDIAKRSKINFYTAEIYRLLSQVSLECDERGEAEEYCRSALTLAQDQGAVSLELRAAVYAIDNKLIGPDDQKQLSERLNQLIEPVGSDAETDDIRSAKTIVSG
jgi:class 3 adenylate cyclase/predicted ATPase